MSGSPLDPRQREATQAADEAFWRRQEQRRERGLGQPCCTQSGVSWSMIDVPGDFAVVVHGEFDCLNCFHHHVGRSARRFFSTRLTEAQLTRGDTQGPLRRCLELIVRDVAPSMVLVLGTCPVEVIGDAFFEVVARVAAETGVPMVPLRTSGLKLTSQREMLDWLYTTLASQARPPAGGPAVNLFGLPGPRRTRPEPAEVLVRAGATLGACLPQAATWADWQGARDARCTVMVDRSMFPRLVAQLEADGQEIIEVGQPTGIGPTVALYQALDAAARAEGRVLAQVAPARQAAEAAVSAARARLSGRRIGVAIRMLNAYHLSALVHEGLGELPALLELGLDVELLVQGAPDPDAQAAFATALSARGFGGLPFQIFPAPWALPELLARERYDLVSLADSSLHAAQQAGTPCLPTGSLLPCFRGAEANARQILSLALGPRR